MELGDIDAIEGADLLEALAILMLLTIFSPVGTLCQDVLSLELNLRWIEIRRNQFMHSVCRTWRRSPRVPKKEQTHGLFGRSGDPNSCVCLNFIHSFLE